MFSGRVYTLFIFSLLPGKKNHFYFVLSPSFLEICNTSLVFDKSPAHPLVHFPIYRGVPKGLACGNPQSTQAFLIRNKRECEKYTFNKYGFVRVYKYDMFYLTHGRACNTWQVALPLHFIIIV